MIDQQSHIIYKHYFFFSFFFFSISDFLISNLIVSVPLRKHVTLSVNIWNHNIYFAIQCRINWYSWIQNCEFNGKMTRATHKYPMNIQGCSAAVENKYPRTSTECISVTSIIFPLILRATCLLVIACANRVGKKMKLPEMLRVDQKESAIHPRGFPLGFSRTYLLVRRRGGRVNARQRCRCWRAGTIGGDRPGVFSKSFPGPVTSHYQWQGS